VQAGRLGLPYLASPVEPLFRLIENYRLHRDALAEGGTTATLPVPIMRTVFVSKDVGTLRRVREGLEQQMAEMRGSASAVMRRRAEGTIDDWAVVGQPGQVAETIARYRDQLGFTHLVVRGAIAGADNGERLDSLETLLSILR
jgi:alkanesulfonate monooxygenase SsuD/methylene tetrahydromethanopterin reductase-like flavin-dependent oxidoreductase (luciferase family)